MKDRRITALLEWLELPARGWIVVDHWDADLCAIGLARADAPRRLVYVSVWRRAVDRFDYECEVPTGPDPTDYRVIATAEDVDLATLVRVLDDHLRT